MGAMLYELLSGQRPFRGESNLQVFANVMTKAPKVVQTRTLAAEALARMTETPPPTTVLFVVEDERPVGILHVHDLLRAGVM